MEEDGGNTGMAQVAGHMVALRVARAADDQALIQQDFASEICAGKIISVFCIRSDHHTQGCAEGNIEK